jgi:hypothetical protein
MRAFYSAGMIVRSDNPSELFSLARQTGVQSELFGPGPVDAFPLPAFAAFFFAPLTYSSYRVAYVLWLTFNVVLLAVLSVAAWKCLDAQPRSTRITLIGAMALSTPVTMLLFLGQVDLLGVTAFALALYFIKRDREAFAGASLLLGLFKPHLLIGAIALLLISGRWRALIAFAIGALALSISPTTILGVDSFGDQISLLRSSPDSFSPYAMANVRGLLYAFVRRDVPMFWLTLTIATGVCAILMSWDVWGQGARRSQSWAVAALIPMVAAPHLHLHSIASTRSEQEITPGLIAIGYVALSALCVTALAGYSLLWIPLAAFFLVCVLRWDDDEPRAHRRTGSSPETGQSVSLRDAA